MFRIIPLAREADGSVRLLTDARLSKQDKRNLEWRLSVRLGCKTVVETLGDSAHDEQRRLDFDATFNRYYRVDFDRMRILLVEPDPARRDQLAATLRSCGSGNVVYTAADLDDDKVSRFARPEPEHVDLVYVGDALADACKRLMPGIPVVALSEATCTNGRGK